MPFVEVVFNLPVKSSFYYRVPDSEDISAVQTGVRVSAGFGKRKLTGFITGVLDKKPETVFEIRETDRIIDKTPLFDSSCYSLALWVSEMYMCSPGEALFSMLPSGRREKEFEFDIPDSDEDELHEVELNEEQREAVEKVRGGTEALFYLHGVTGSGKTEVYLSLAQDSLDAGKSVIYLVPEIALTHQLTEYVTGRFGNMVAVLHSGLTPSQKLSQWRRIQSGEARIVLGARSAVFAPVREPGLIIIDEEHESTYKSGSSPRYHARQVAMHRAKISGARVIMGSATPSVEAYHLMAEGRIKRVELKRIASGGSPAPVQIVDMGREKSAVSRLLADEIRHVTSSGGQVILFLNRRGFFYYYHCMNCGFELRCRQCSVSLTYHRDIDRLVCHYCGYSEKPSRVCPGCGSPEVGYSGFGTEKVESDVKALFPYLRSERIDRDSIKKSSDLKNIFERFRKREIDILLGTQIIAKGLNFPGVKLVGIILADTTLQLPDFRAAERTFALITQVAGRTGRFNADGKVIIQTFRPGNYAVRLAAERRLRDFYASEIENRKAMGFPPFSRVIRVVFRSKEREKALSASELFAVKAGEKAAGREENTRILGPSECPVAQIAGSYRFHVIVHSPLLSTAHFTVRSAAENLKLPGGVYMEIDVDPVSLM